MTSRLARTVKGKTVVVTGASDGIGAHLAKRLGAAGARVVLVARTAEKLKTVGNAIRFDGGVAFEYTANLAEDEDAKRVVADILADHETVDVFVSNAGRSIRRSCKYQSRDRFHDFQRLMSLNYFGALRAILGVLPSMIEQRSGHIVHVSSFAVPTRQPRFGGYAASKSALDATLASMAGEVAANGVDTSTVYMPLVQTKMVESRGHSYDHVGMLSLDLACELIEHAIVTREAEVIDAPSRFLNLLHYFRPSMIVGLNSIVYKLEGECPPDLTEEEQRARLERQARKREKVATSRCSPLRLLTTVMWFFSRLELAFLKIGIGGVVRDPIICAIMACVLLVHSVYSVLRVAYDVSVCARRCTPLRVCWQQFAGGFQISANRRLCENGAASSGDATPQRVAALAARNSTCTQSRPLSHFVPAAVCLVALLMSRRESFAA